MIVLDNLSNQLAAIGDAEKVSDALERLKPQGLVTDSVSSDDIRQGQAFLRYLGLNEVAEWLEGYMGVSNSWYDDEGRYVIKINGKLLGGDIPAETAGSVLRSIRREKQERASRVYNVGRTETQRALMRPPSASPGLVNPSVLDLPFRSVVNGRVLTVQEVEQATRRLAELDLLVPEPGHYTVNLNGLSVPLAEGRQARRVWNEEMQTIRQDQRRRQQEMAPPARPVSRGTQQRQVPRPTLDQVAGRSLVGSRGGEQIQGAGERSRAQEGTHRDRPSRVLQGTLVQRPFPSATAIPSAPAPMDIDSGSSRTMTIGSSTSRTMGIQSSTSSTMNMESGTSRTATYDHDQGPQQRQKDRPLSSTNEAHQTEATIAEKSQSPNVATIDYLLSIGIDLSLHKPPQVDALPGSPTLEQKTITFSAANKAILDAMEQQEIEEDEEEALRLRQTSEARTLRSNSVYSSRFPSEAPSVVPPAAATTITRPRGNRKTRGNPYASVALALPGLTHEQMARRWEEAVSREEVGGSGQPVDERSQDTRAIKITGTKTDNPAMEREREAPTEVQVATERRAPNETPHHHAPTGNGSLRQAPTAAATTQNEEARPAVAVATPPAAPQTPASQKKNTRIILKIGGRRVVSQSTLVTDTPRSEPPVHTSPPTLGYNYTEPTNRYREVSQEHPLPTPRRNLFGTVSQQHQPQQQQQRSPYPTSGVAPATASLAQPITPQGETQAVDRGESQNQERGRAMDEGGKR